MMTCEPSWRHCGAEGNNNVRQEFGARGLRGRSQGEGEEDVTVICTIGWRGIDRGPRLRTNCNQKGETERPPFLARCDLWLF
jgi:hypothetical protein